MVFKEDIKRLILFLLPIIVLIGSFNYFIDPGNIFKSSANETQIAAALASDYNVGFTLTMSQVDESKLLKSSIKTFKKPFDALVLGSSRAFPLHKDMFKGYTFYNASISSCRLGDALAIYNLFEKNDLAPKGVVISVDPDFFVLNPIPKSDLWNDFVECGERIGMKIAIHEKIFFLAELTVRKIRKTFELFSPSYFQDSFKVFLFKKFGWTVTVNNPNSTNFKKLGYYTTLEEQAPGGMIFPDGSKEYPAKDRVLRGKERANMIAKYILDMERVKNKSFVMRNDSKKIFENFVDYLLKKNIRVLFVLIPEHPIFYRYEVSLNRNDPVPLAVENYLLEFAQSRNIKILGSYDCGRAGLSGSDMIDHHHPRRSSIYKLVRTL